MIRQWLNRLRRRETPPPTPLYEFRVCKMAEGQDWKVTARSSLTQGNEMVVPPLLWVGALAIHVCALSQELQCDPVHVLQAVGRYINSPNVQVRMVFENEE